MTKLVFWSSVDPSPTLKQLIEKLSLKGYDSDVNYLISNDSYRIKDNIILKLILKFKMYIAYPVYVVYKLLTDRNSAINIVTTNTFYTPLIVLLFSPKQNKTIHLVWDLYPNIIYYVDHKNYFLESFIVRNILYSISSRIFKRSDANIFLTEKIKENTLNTYKYVSNPQIIPVSSNNFFVYNDEKFNKINDIKIYYIGNFGIFHNVNLLIDFFKNNNQNVKNYSFHFYSSGSNYDKLKKFILNNHNDLINNVVFFNNSLNSIDYINLMNSICLSLVSLSSNADQFLFPSKVFSAMAAGQAILAICDFDSELAKLIIDNDCGWVVSPNSTIDFNNTLNHIIHNKEEIKRKMKNSFIAFNTKFNIEIISETWIRVFEEILNK